MSFLYLYTQFNKLEIIEEFTTVTVILETVHCIQALQLPEGNVSGHELERDSTPQPPTPINGNPEDDDEIVESDEDEYHNSHESDILHDQGVSKTLSAFLTYFQQCQV